MPWIETLNTASGSGPSGILAQIPWTSCAVAYRVNYSARFPIPVWENDKMIMIQ
jgi:hypothetical protein